MIRAFPSQGTGWWAWPRASRNRAGTCALDRTVFWRIMFFYIGAIAVIGTLLPAPDEPAERGR